MHYLRSRLTFGIVLVGLVSALLGFAPGARAQMGPTLLLMPFPPDRNGELTADFFHIPDVEPEGAGTGFTLSIIESDITWQLPGEWARKHKLRLQHRLDYFDADIAANINSAIDQSLLAGMYIGDLGDWQMEVVVGVGFAQTNPYADSKGLYAIGTIMLSQQLDEQSRLSILASYDGNRSLLPDIPLPGVAYTRVEDETLIWTVGLPFSSLTWKPDDRWTIQINFALLYNFDAYVNFKVVDELHLFGRFNGRQWAFQQDGLRRHDRMLFEQRRVELGARVLPCDWFEMEVAGGYAFGQETNFGFDVRQHRNGTDFEDAFYIRVGGVVRF